ncbi:MAG TPA: YciI family protein [Dokdonella sp.]|nr:YciI family protein [Dokdonella sp.]
MSAPMQFLLIIRHGASFVPTAALVAEIMAWADAARHDGVRVEGRPLRPAHEAMRVRRRGERTLLQRGRFDSADEQVAAYELIACASEEDALAIAASHPMARAATIEVREVWVDIDAAIGVQADGR